MSILSASFCWDQQNGPRPLASLPRSFIRGDHFAEATVSQSLKSYEGKPLTFPAEAAGPKAEYLQWHIKEHGF